MAEAPCRFGESGGGKKFKQLAADTLLDIGDRHYDVAGFGDRTSQLKVGLGIRSVGLSEQDIKFDQRCTARCEVVVNDVVPVPQDLLADGKRSTDGEYQGGDQPLPGHQASPPPFHQELTFRIRSAVRIRSCAHHSNGTSTWATGPKGD